MCTVIERWAAEHGRQKRTEDLVLPPPGLDDSIRAMVGAELEAAYRTIAGKQERGEAVGALKERVRSALGEGPEAETECSKQQEQQRQRRRYDEATLNMAWKVRLVRPAAVPLPALLPRR